jgi:RNA polymerase sigma-70 factor (ECF subfamily)
MEPSNQPISRPPSDAQIVERVRRGDAAAYGTLVERYERAALAAALPVLRDVHAAQDVVQDVFVLCFTKLASLRDGSRFGPWLLKTVGRESVHASRRSRRMRIEQSDVGDDVHAASDDDRLLSDERERLLRCVQALPAHERAAVSLRYFEGYGVNDIARITGSAVGTITKQLSRAIQRLREQLAREDESWKPRTKQLAR